MLLVRLFVIFHVAQAANKELREQYRQYSECIKRREFGLKDSRHIEVIVVPRGADVVLPCFSCVSPEDAMEIESTYKPSAGSVGRAFKKVIDFFKKRLSNNPNIFDKYKWTYDWEHATPSFSWDDLTRIHAKKKLSERVGEKIKRFLRRDTSKWSLGDRYELKLNKVDRNNSGFYRCINKQGRNRRMAGAYFLDVKTQLNTVMIKSDKDKIPVEVLEIIKMQKDETTKLKFAPKASTWSVCNRCGNVSGEQTRTIQCIVEASVPHLSHLPNTSSWLKLFGSAPCSSTVVPLKIRKKFQPLPTLVQYRSCKLECHSQEVTDRNITSVDELGETRVMDYIPKGEFLFGEVLPRLLPPVIRSAYLVVEGDPVIFTCDSNPDEPTGVQWHTDRILNLDIESMLLIFKNRVWIDEHGRLGFNGVEMTDRGMYFCYNTERVLLGVHHLMVVENERTKEVIANVQMLLRFAAFVCIFVLIIGQLLK